MQFYELARCGPLHGVISPDFVPAGGMLLSGNDLLMKSRGLRSEDLEPKQLARLLGLRGVLSHLQRLSDDGLCMPRDFVPFEGIETPLDVFVGYLLFDAWIANPDRHGENWGIVTITPAEDEFLAPAFDHGAAMGRSLLDGERAERLRTKDRGRATLTHSAQRLALRSIPWSLASASKRRERSKCVRWPRSTRPSL